MSPGLSVSQSPREVGEPWAEVSSPGLGGFVWGGEEAGREGKGESHSFLVPPLHLILPTFSLPHVMACPMKCQELFPDHPLPMLW